MTRRGVLHGEDLGKAIPVKSLDGLTGAAAVVVMGEIPVGPREEPPEREWQDRGRKNGGKSSG